MEKKQTNWLFMVLIALVVIAIIVMVVDISKKDSVGLAPRTNSKLEASKDRGPTQSSTYEVDENCIDTDTSYLYDTIIIEDDCCVDINGNIVTAESGDCNTDPIPASQPDSDCNDGIDNDGDGAVDHPADSGCQNPNDQTETNCGDGQCENGETTEGCFLPEGDCPDPNQGGGFCGNDICEFLNNETCSTCDADCRIGPTCGDGICQMNAAVPEDCGSCPEDCAGIQNTNPNNRFCCGTQGNGNNPVDCSDNRCNGNDGQGFSCNIDDIGSPSCDCGDGICDGYETEANCPFDCTVDETHIECNPSTGACDLVIDGPGPDQCSSSANCVYSACSNNSTCETIFGPGNPDECAVDVDCP